MCTNVIGKRDHDVSSRLLGLIRSINYGDDLALHTVLYSYGTRYSVSGTKCTLVSRQRKVDDLRVCLASTQARLSRTVRWHVYSAEFGFLGLSSSLTAEI